jgi:DNA-binding response OmpR family regulator
MKILIIEDEHAIRETLRELLELNGFEVLVACDGAEGVKLAESNPDFIFCDVSMPRMDGFAAIAAIHLREAGRQVPFVFLTAKADRADQRQGMALGADDYITKPFTEKEVLEAIAARTKRHRSVQERVAELVEQRRRQVGADWSHELLTPLNGMLGGLQLLEMEIETVSREELKEMVALIRGGVERQEKLSRKLIRHFELERMREEPRPAVGFRCKAEAATAAGVARALEGTGREADLELLLAPGEVPLPEPFLTDAVAELAGNALRFSARGQRVAVRAAPSGSCYRIVVTDEGPGMAPAEREMVAAFAQFGRARREQQGLGLGLAIAREVAQLGGGTLRLAEGPGGRGLAATIELPLLA